MASKYIGDLVFSTGEYEKDGQTKKSWTKAAAVFEYEDGGLSFKFEAFPADPNWSGYMKLFRKDHKPQEQQRDVAPQDVSDEPINLENIPF